VGGVMNKRTHSTIESFNTGGPAMTLFYLVANEDKPPIIESTPVLGWIHTRHHYSDGSTEDNIEPGVFDSDCRVVETDGDMFNHATNTEVIGVYPNGTEPTDADLDQAKSLLHERLVTEWREAESMQEPYRTKRRESIGRMGKALVNADRPRDTRARALRMVGA
jgi:hypothetical protein